MERLVTTTSTQHQHNKFPNPDREGAKELQIFQRSSTDHLSAAPMRQQQREGGGFICASVEFSSASAKFPWNLLEPGVRCPRQQIPAAPRHPPHFTQHQISLDFLWLHLNTGKCDTNAPDRLIVTFNLRNSMWDTDFRP